MKLVVFALSGTIDWMALVGCTCSGPLQSAWLDSLSEHFPEADQTFHNVAHGALFMLSNTSQTVMPDFGSGAQRVASVLLSVTGMHVRGTFATSAFAV